LTEEDFDAYGERAIALPGVGKYRILNTVARGRRLDVVGKPVLDANGNAVVDADGKPVLGGTYPRFKFYPSYHIECEVEALAGLAGDEAQKTYDRGAKEEDKGVAYFHNAVRKMFESKLPNVDINPEEVAEIIREFLVAYMQKANTGSAAKVLSDYLDKKMIEASSVAAGISKPVKRGQTLKDGTLDMVGGTGDEDPPAPDDGYDDPTDTVDESDDDDEDLGKEFEEATAPAGNGKKTIDPMDFETDDGTGLPDENEDNTPPEAPIGKDASASGFGQPDPAADKVNKAADKEMKGIDEFDFDM
jgi:hypothetical protein